MSTTVVAMALYRPHPGKEEELQEIVKQHVPILREEGLITDYPPLLLKAKDGTLIEIFEWKCDEAKNQAHQNPKVQVLWKRMMEVAEMTHLSTLPESDRPFPNFKRIQ